MNHSQNNPLQGQTLEKILLALVDRYGWEELGQRIDIKCFNVDPSIKSSLTFLRKTPVGQNESGRTLCEHVRRLTPDMLIDETYSFD
jgi:uncharacterized protein (DUF2132 family)